MLPKARKTGLATKFGRDFRELEESLSKTWTAVEHKSEKRNRSEDKASERSKDNRRLFVLRFYLELHFEGDVVFSENFLHQIGGLHLGHDLIDHIT